MNLSRRRESNSDAYEPGSSHEGDCKDWNRVWGRAARADRSVAITVSRQGETPSTVEFKTNYQKNDLFLHLYGIRPGARVRMLSADVWGQIKDDLTVTSGDWKPVRDNKPETPLVRSIRKILNGD